MALRVIAVLTADRTHEFRPERLRCIDRRHPLHVEPRPGERALQARRIVETPVSTLDYTGPGEGTVRSDEETSLRA